MSEPEIPATNVAEAVAEINRKLPMVKALVGNNALGMIVQAAAPSIRSQAIGELRERLLGAVTALIRIQSHGALTENEQHMIDIAREALLSMPEDLKDEAVAALDAAQKGETV